MKKLLAVSFCTTLVLGVASSAFAIHMTAPEESSSVVAMGGLITMDGSIRHRGFLTSTSTAKDATKQAAGYDTRVRLGTTVKTSDAVTGRVVLETDGGQNIVNSDGIFNSSDTYSWGWGDSNGLNQGGHKKGYLNILEAWIQYVPGNWGIKAGHMPLLLGNKLFFDHSKYGDDAIVAFMSPNEATHIAALTIKFEEGTSASFTTTPALSFKVGPSNVKYSDDINGYVLLGSYKAGAMNFGADWTYLTQGTELGANPSFPGLSFSNIGLRGDLGISGFDIKADVEFQTGQVVDIPGTKLDAGGWAGMLEGSTTLGGAFNVGLGLYYGSGDDNPNDTDIDTFINFLGGTRYQSTMNGYILASPATGAKNMGIQNQTEVQLYASTDTVCPLSGKDLNLKARLNWMKVNEEVYPGQDDSIGTEIELFANWKLAPGLVYGVEGAYLFTGDAWIPVNAAGTAPTTGADVDNVFFLRHRLELTW